MTAAKTQRQLCYQNLQKHGCWPIKAGAQYTTWKQVTMFHEIPSLWLSCSGLLLAISFSLFLLRSLTILCSFQTACLTSASYRVLAGDSSMQFSWSEIDYQQSFLLVCSWKGMGLICLFSFGSFLELFRVIFRCLFFVLLGFYSEWKLYFPLDYHFVSSLCKHS